MGVLSLFLLVISLLPCSDIKHKTMLTTVLAQFASTEMRNGSLLSSDFVFIAGLDMTNGTLPKTFLALVSTSVENY